MADTRLYSGTSAVGWHLLNGTQDVITFNELVIQTNDTIKSTQRSKLGTLVLAYNLPGLDPSLGSFYYTTFEAKELWGGGFYLKLPSNQVPAAAAAVSINVNWLIPGVPWWAKLTG